jgi:hypothetical protein
MNTLYLSRRNLLTLLSKLDRKAEGEQTQCTVIKNQNPASDKFKQTMVQIAVVAVEDDEYYGAQNRPAGVMHPADEVNTTVPSTGLGFQPFVEHVEH